MRETNEYVIEWVIGDEKATCTVPENTALNNKLTRLAEEYPQEVEIINSELFRVPARWVKISPPRKMSEEQRQQASERLKNARNALNTVEENG
jgi:hypothetical protein